MQKLSLLGDLIDIREQIDRDHQLDRLTLRQRDRAIGLQHSGKGLSRNRPGNQLRLWITAIRENSEQHSNGHHIDRILRTLMVICWLAGALLGYLLARSILAYDGSQPVNLLTALLVLVGIQLIALLIMVVLSTLRRRKMLSALSVLNPVNLLNHLAGRLQPEWRQTLQMLSARMQHVGHLGLAPRLLMYLAQHFSVALNIGILATLFYLVTVSDLAFGWNSTLDLDNDTVAGIFQFLAIPWQSILPDAVPDHSLIEASRYYRLQSQLTTSGWQAKQLGTWWIYLVMCIAVYGFLPRLIALIVTGMQYDRACIQALESLPGSNQVLSRMSDPLVDTHAADSQSGADETVTRPGLPGRQAARKMQCLVIEWSECNPADSQLEKAGVTPTARMSAGGRQSTSADKTTAAATTQGAHEAVAITAKAWEPPMLEVTDFIALVRGHQSATYPLIVLLQPLPDTKVTAAQIEAWDSMLGQLSDPALYLESL